MIGVMSRAQASEVLFEEGGWRVVTGDWAARTARGIAGEPVPTDVSVEQIEKLMNAEMPEPFPVPPDAVQAGVKRFGWAQIEFEPEQVSGKKIHGIVVSGGDSRWLSDAVYDIERGPVATLGLSLSDGTLRIGDVDVPELDDRSVYASLSSPENFVLTQEHFRKQLFESMLNLSYPGLERVRRAYQDNKYALALYELSEYYRRKEEPRGMHRRVSEHPESSSDPNGDRICDHVFTEYDTTIEMGPVIEWNRQPAGAPSAEWLWNFNSHHHFAVLLEAYLKTAKEKYAREFVNEMTDFVIQNPAPPYTLTRVGSWRNLEAGNRMMVSWPQSFYGFLSSPSFTPQALALMLGSIWSHGQYLHDHPAGLRRPSNWSVVDSLGLVGVSVYWPELADAETWRKAGFDRLQHQLDLQVYPDGAQYELAPSYHLYCLDRFKRALVLAQQTGVALPDEYAKGVVRMYAYVMWMMKPDGTVPAFSDSKRNDVQSLLREGAELFGREDMRYAATNGAEGRAPESTLRMLPYAGYAVMRSDWSKDARYLCFDGGPVGTNHQHEDKLSFVLSAYGTNFIIDPGPYLYTLDDWRKWCVSSAAHSTVLIDGQGQRRIRAGQELMAPEAPAPVWQSTDTFDYACAAYEGGYGPAGTEVTHRRHVLFQKPRYWVIVDEILGEGTHTIDSLFHFAAGQMVRVDDDRRVATHNPTGPNLALEAGGANDLHCTVVEGQKEPTIQGWDATHGKEVKPAPTAIFTQETSLPVTRVFLLYPTREGEQAGTLRECHLDEQALTVLVSAPGRKSDTICFELDERRVQVEE